MIICSISGFKLLLLSQLGIWSALRGLIFIIPAKEILDKMEIRGKIPCEEQQWRKSQYYCRLWLFLCTYICRCRETGRAYNNIEIFVTVVLRGFSNEDHILKLRPELEWLSGSKGFSFFSKLSMLYPGVFIRRMAQCQVISNKGYLCCMMKWWGIVLDILPQNKQ